MSSLAPVVNVTNSLEQDASRLALAHESFSRIFDGAVISFKIDGTIDNVKLASDSSTIQILGLQGDSSVQTVADLLKALDYSIPITKIQLKALGGSTALAEVTVDDPTFADNVVHKYLRNAGLNRRSRLSIKKVQGRSTATGVSNKLQISSVTCTWYRASRVAWLHYDSAKEAEESKRYLERHPVIQGRTIQCTVKPPPRTVGRDSASRVQVHGRIWSVQIGNLDPQTSQNDLRRALTNPKLPKDIILGPNSHDYGDYGPEAIVKNLLIKFGDLVIFEVSPHRMGASKMKAIATFADIKMANAAVRDLNNSQVPEFGNSKIFVNHLISMKYNVLNVIYHIIEPDISRLRGESWQKGHIHIKSYPSVDPQKPITALKLFGEDIKEVAHAKASLEALLAGTIMKSDDAAVWHHEFVNADFLTFLTQTSTKYNLYVHRDTRKSRLIMYGDGKDNQAKATDAVLARSQAELRQTNVIRLDDDMFKAALRGGWRRIKTKYGDSATLDIVHRPKVIRIQGPLQELQRARELLFETDTGPAADTSTDADCLICLSESTELMTTHCGHNYCKECFANQCLSAKDGGLPIKCYGAEGACLAVIGLDELKVMLLAGGFEELLSVSFEHHIRTHPDSYHYCPTPDCKRFYRCSNNGTVFFCDLCLSSVCTSCNVLAHDNITCEEYKDLTSEGTKAFQQWKQRNDVRDCPKCKAPIQKLDGCNHMTCRNCNNDICWFCMASFDSSGLCYAHMQRTHSSLYN